MAATGSHNPDLQPPSGTAWNLPISPITDVSSNVAGLATTTHLPRNSRPLDHPSSPSLKPAWILPHRDGLASPQRFHAINTSDVQATPHRTLTAHPSPVDAVNSSCKAMTLLQHSAGPMAEPDNTHVARGLKFEAEGSDANDDGNEQQDEQGAPDSPAALKDGYDAQKDAGPSPMKRSVRMRHKRAGSDREGAAAAAAATVSSHRYQPCCVCNTTKGSMTAVDMYGNECWSCLKCSKPLREALQLGLGASDVRVAHAWRILQPYLHRFRELLEDVGGIEQRSQLNAPEILYEMKREEEEEEDRARLADDEMSDPVEQDALSALLQLNDPAMSMPSTPARPVCAPQESPSRKRKLRTPPSMSRQPSAAALDPGSRSHSLLQDEHPDADDGAHTPLVARRSTVPTSTCAACGVMKPWGMFNFRERVGEDGNLVQEPTSFCISCIESTASLAVTEGISAIAAWVTNGGMKCAPFAHLHQLQRSPLAKHAYRAGDGARADSPGALHATGAFASRRPRAVPNAARFAGRHWTGDSGDRSGAAGRAPVRLGARKDSGALSSGSPSANDGVSGPSDRSGSIGEESRSAGWAGDGRQNFPSRGLNVQRVECAHFGDLPSPGLAAVAAAALRAKLQDEGIPLVLEQPRARGTDKRALLQDSTDSYFSDEQ